MRGRIIQNMHTNVVQGNLMQAMTSDGCLYLFRFLVSIDSGHNNGFLITFYENHRSSDHTILL